MKKRKLACIFSIMIVLILFGNLIPVSAITGSMGNAKMILYPEVDGWKTTTIEKTILVKNVNNVSINITLDSNENPSEFLEIIDKTFILGPGEEKKAQFLVKVRKEGKYEGRINVFFKPIEGKEPGVVLSSTIIVIAKKDQGYEEEEIAEDYEDNQEKITGQVIGEISENKTSNGTKFLIASAFALIFILIILILAGKKRSTKSKHKKI